MDSPRSNRLPSLKKVVALIRSNARATQRTNACLPGFNRLYRFYSQLENERPPTGLAVDERPPVDVADTPTAPDQLVAELTLRNTRQQTVQSRYSDYPGCYALLASFYLAFIAPLEQDIAIAETCEELQLISLEVGPGRQRARIQATAFDWRAAQAELAGLTGLFDALGTLITPVFNLNDFMRDARRQTQDDF